MKGQPSKRWTDAETEILVEHHAEGVEALMALLPGRTEMSIMLKCHDMKLSVKKAPIPATAQEQPEPPAEPAVETVPAGLCSECGHPVASAECADCSIDGHDNWTAKDAGPTEATPGDTAEATAGGCVEGANNNGAEATQADMEFVASRPVDYTLVTGTVRVGIDVQGMLDMLGLPDGMKVRDLWLERPPVLGAPPVLVAIVDGPGLPVVAEGEVIPDYIIVATQRAPFEVVLSDV